MGKIYEPKENIIYSKRLYLKRLKECKELNDKFIETITSTIAPTYDEINKNFAKRLIEIDSNGYDEHGYFTLGKEIWVIFKRENNTMIGFEVITRKRGGSIKLGPTYISAEYRGEKFSKEAIEILCDEYIKYGARKVYVTAPLEHVATAVLDFKYLNLNLEAILNKHYSESSSERVCGKIFNKIENIEEISPRIEMGEKKITDIKNKLYSISFDELNNFVIEYMSKSFDDIDVEFTQSIWNNTAQENIKNDYEKKEKDIFLSEKNSEINALAVACPKRGGNYKISPFLIADEYHNEENINLLIDCIEKKAWNMGRRKITFFIPMNEIIISKVLSKRNYYTEGILKEPYKINKDIIVFSKFGGTN